MIINIHFVQSRELFVSQGVGKHLPFQLPHPFPPGLSISYSKHPLCQALSAKARSRGYIMDWSWLGVLTVSDQSAPAIPIAEECKCYFTMWGSSDLMLIQTIIQRQRKQKTEPFYLIFHDSCLLSLKFYWIILVSFWSHNHRNKSYQCEILQQQQYVCVRVWLSALFIYHSLHSKFTAEIFLIPELFFA